jgi:hypothetical protein
MYACCPQKKLNQEYLKEEERLFKNEELLHIIQEMGSELFHNYLIKQKILNYLENS